MLVFSMIFWLHWALFGIGSYAIRPHICSPNTLFSFFFLKKSPWRPSNESLFEYFLIKYVIFVWKNGFQKLLQKKVPRQSQTRTYSQARRLPERQPHVRAVQTRNSCLSSSWSTVWDFCRKKVDYAENWCEKMTGLLNCSQKNWMDCWLLKTKASVERKC